MKILRRDSMLFGIIFGICLPAVCFGILYAITTVFAPEGKDYLIKLPNIMLLSIFSNLFTLRYYLLTLKYDKTGRGILLVTFILAIAFFALHFSYFEKMGML